MIQTNCHHGINALHGGLEPCPVPNDFHTGSDELSLKITLLIDVIGDVPSRIIYPSHSAR
jgi:hypothetical protein